MTDDRFAVQHGLIRPLQARLINMEGLQVPQIVVQTKDLFAAAMLCEWEEHHNIDTMAVSRPNNGDWMRVILYGIDVTDPLFREFWEIVNTPDEKGDFPWIPSSIDPTELSEIVVELACEDWWQASFVSLPQVFLGGPTAEKAIAALCQDFGIELSRLNVSNSREKSRLLFHVTPRIKGACPSCRGTGLDFCEKSVGICVSCHGSGTT